MSVISTSGLTLGYLTFPAASAAGLPGSCLTRNAEPSGRILPSATTFASSMRSSAEENVGTFRRYGSPPAVDAVESALAMFSEITLIRPACARSPDVAMPIERAKSPPSFAMMSFPQLLVRRLALADRGLQKMQALAVERSHRGIVHLVGGHLEHLVFQSDGVAGRPRLENPLPILFEGLPAAARWRDMRGAGAHHRQRSHRARACA